MLDTDEAFRVTSTPSEPLCSATGVLRGRCDCLARGPVCTPRPGVVSVNNSHGPDGVDRARKGEGGWGLWRALPGPRHCNLHGACRARIDRTRPGPQELQLGSSTRATLRHTLAGAPMRDSLRTTPPRHRSGGPGDASRSDGPEASPEHCGTLSLSAEELSRRTATPLRTVQRWLARWREARAAGDTTAPRVVQVPRPGRVGGVAWGVLAEDLPLVSP